MSELVSGTFKYFDVEFHYSGLVAGLFFSGMYLYSWLYSDRSSWHRKLSSPLCGNIPYFFYLDFLYPWVLTFASLYWRQDDASSSDAVAPETNTAQTTPAKGKPSKREQLWRSIAGLWIFTGLGWSFRGTLLEIYYIVASTLVSKEEHMQDSAVPPKNDTTSKDQSQIAKPKQVRLLPKRPKTLLVLLNVVWIWLTFLFTFPNSSPFFNFIYRYFGFKHNPVAETDNKIPEKK